MCQVTGDRLSRMFNDCRGESATTFHEVRGLAATLLKNAGNTNKQIKELGIYFTPQHPEDELIKAGVIFESKTAFRDVFANLTISDEEAKFVTGQNQNAGHETPQKMMEKV